MKKVIQFFEDQLYRNPDTIESADKICRQNAEFSIELAMELTAKVKELKSTKGNPNREIFETDLKSLSGPNYQGLRNKTLQSMPDESNLIKIYQQLLSFKYKPSEDLVELKSQLLALYLYFDKIIFLLDPASLVTYMRFTNTLMKISRFLSKVVLVSVGPGH